MAITAKGQKWEWKNSWFILLAIIPPLACISYFIMYGRTQKKSYLIKAFATILVTMLLFFATPIGDAYYNANRKDYPDEGRPEVSDYLDKDYYTKDNYEDTPEYKAYEDAYEKYYKSSAYQAVQEHNSQLIETRQTLVRVIIIVCVFTLFLITLTIIFIDRPKYLRLLLEKENSQFVSSAMSARNRVSNIPATAPSPAQAPAERSAAPVPPSDYQNSGYDRSQNTYQQNTNQFQPAVSGAAQNNTAMLDVNRMTEEDFSKVALLNVIDVKRIMEFRNTNGSFVSKDQFFESFNAKPHVIVKLSDSILIDSAQQTNGYKNDYSSRRFDL